MTVSSSSDANTSKLESSAKLQASSGGWVAWLVLSGLLLVGLVGGLGGLPTSFVKPKDAPEAASKLSAAPPTKVGSTESAEGEGLPAGIPTPMLARGLAADGAANGPKTIEARHVLVQYKGSWYAAAEVTRSRDDAAKRAEEALRKLKKGEEFSAVMNAYTDSKDVKNHQGQFGVLDRDTAMRAIAEPAFALKVGEYSQVVESPFGFHVIQRTK